MNIKEIDSQYVANTYARFPVQLQCGKGSLVWDEDGREYIDMGSGIAVNAFGVADGAWAAAVSAQLGRLQHCSNLYYSEPCALLAEQLCRRTGMKKVFFGNSGAEANECAIKCARKYAADKYGAGNRYKIVTLKNSFHGRTLTTLAATGQDEFHADFQPLTPGFLYAEANDCAALRALVEGDGAIAAIMFELVQGEGGVLPMDPEYVHDLAVLCAERDWLLLVDEVQTGIGRTGTLFAFQQYGIQPDACSFAKGIAGGLPMGGFLVNEKCRNILGPGTHGSTFGGNPVSAAAGCAVLEVLDDATIAQVKEKGAYIRQSIEDMHLPCLGKTRGLGLMIGIDVAEGYNNKELCAKLNVGGLLTLTAGTGLRFLPPLLITQEEMDKGLSVFHDVLSKV